MSLATLAPPSVPARFEFVPEHSSSLGDDAVAFAAATGLELDDWQAEVLRGAMAQDRSGRWAGMEVGLVVPRQNGKGSILEALELFHLFCVPTTKLITHTAHRFDTCLDHFRRVRERIEATPELLALVEDNGRGVNGPSGIKDSNGKESITLRNGCKIAFKAREKGSGRGFSGDLVVLDEFFWAMDLSGLIPTMATRANPQAWYTSSAPLPRVESDMLRALIRDGRALALDPAALRGPDDPTLTYFEWSVAAGSAGRDLGDLLAELLEDDDRLAEGNPAYGIRLTKRFCKLEARRLGPEATLRERFGIFPDSDDAPRWLTVPEAQWNDRLDREAPEDGWLADPITLSVELSQDGETATLCAAGTVRDGVGVTAVFRGPASELVAEVVAWKESGRVGRWVLDTTSRAAALRDDLEAAGVEFTEIKTGELREATGWFVDRCRDGGVWRREDPWLTDSLASAVPKRHGNAWLVNRWADGDPTPTIGAISACWGHLQGPADDGVSVYEQRGPVVLG